MTIAHPGAPGALPTGGRVVRDLRLPSREQVSTALRLLLAAALTLAGCSLIRWSVSSEISKQQAYAFVRAAGRGYSDRELAELIVGSDPGALAIAASHDPDGPQAAWARPPGWKRLDIDTAPTLGLDHLSMGAAQRINGAIPTSQFASPPAVPFFLHANAAERAQATGCLTAAIYYEAALEPLAGQQAVAQVVINRMRHAGFPKSVCWVVFQGSERPGCQFSFACDGSMARPPAAWAWKPAEQVAERALDGFVMKEVGTATHYHTDWIMAAWTPTLIKVAHIGQHIFFRPTGSEGQPAAFEDSYRGGEAQASRLDLIGKASTASSAPVALVRASTPGSMAAPASIVRGGRLIMLPPGSIFPGRVHGLVGTNGGLQTGIYRSETVPMHAMIALRAAAARAALRAASLEAQAAAQPDDPPAPPDAAN